MSSQINIPNCGGATSTFNIGVPLCDVIRDIPYGLIFLDSGVTFNEAETTTVAAFVTAVKTATKAARGSRAYPMWDLKNFEDKSKEATKGTLGNLSNTEIQLVDGIPSFSFTHRKGDLFHKLLVKAETANLKVMIVDKKYVVYGTVTSGGELTGYTMAEFKAGLPKFQTPGAASSYPFDITLESITEYKENLGFMQADSTLVGAAGLRDVVLSASVAGSVLSVGLVATGGTNIATLFATELLQTAAWSVVKTVGGGTPTISPAYNSTTGKIDITLSGATWTGAVTNDAFTVNLVAAATLAGLGSPIDGYESTGAVSFLKP